MGQFDLRSERERWGAPDAVGDRKRSGNPQRGGDGLDTVFLFHFFPSDLLPFSLYGCSKLSPCWCDVHTLDAHVSMSGSMDFFPLSCLQFHVLVIIHVLSEPQYNTRSSGCYSGNGCQVQLRKRNSRFET